MLCAQQLLRSAPLASHASAGPLVEAAAGDMAEAASSGHAQSARRLQLLAAGVPRGAKLLSTLTSVLTAGSLSSADTHTLHGLLDSDGAGAPRLLDYPILHSFAESGEHTAIGSSFAGKLGLIPPPKHTMASVKGAADDPR